MSIKPVLFVAVVYWIAHLAVSLGAFQRTYNHSPGQCALLKSLEYGSADMEVLPNGLVFISSGVWAQNSEQYRNRPGRIYLFDFNTPSTPPQPLKIMTDETYKLISPLGLSVWTDKKRGLVYLYVISHQPTMNVDKFRYDNSKRTLQHVRRFNDDKFIALADIVVVGEDQFYFTNEARFSVYLETIVGVHWGSLGFYDGQQSTLIESKLATPRGLSLSINRKFLYVAVSGTEVIRVYKRQPDDALTFSHTIEVNTKINHLYVDMKTGDLWFAAHTSAFRFLQYIHGLAHHSPSQVMRVRLDADSHVIKLEEIYSNDGVQLSAATVAVAHGNRLLVGSAISQALYCEMR